MTTTIKALKKIINAKKNEWREERANAMECFVYSDAIREAGDDRLADMWMEVGEFLQVWSDHLRIVGDWTSMQTTFASDRNKFIALDQGVNATGASGVFLLEKETGYVWSIKGYGKKNRIIRTSLRELTEEYRANLEEHAARK